MGVVGVNFKFIRDVYNAAKANDANKLRSVINSNQDTLLLFWMAEQRSDTRGWYSGSLPNPGITAGDGAELFNDYITSNVTIVYSENQQTDSCKAGNDDYNTPICKKILGEVKSNSTSSTGTTG